MARDDISYQTAIQLYDKEKVLVLPDIVTTLIGKYNFSENRNSVLFCLRNDNEKLYSDEELEKLMNIIREKYGNVDRTDTNSCVTLEEMRHNIKSILEEEFKIFAKYKIVVTDRYHGTIFSLISNTPVIVLNSTDHKLSSGINWFKGIYDEYVYYAKSLNEVERFIDTIMSKKYTYKLDDYFETKYYSNLLNSNKKE